MNRLAIPIFAALCLSSCGEEPKKAYEQAKPSVPMAPPQAAPAAAASVALDSVSQKKEAVANKSAQPVAASAPKMERKVIRTADLRFKVASTEQTTYKIEQLTKHFGGYVTQTNLEGSVIKQFDLPSGSDSTAHITHYEVENNMTLRVPNEQLDTVLAAISHLYLFLNHRRVSGEDVTTSYLANRLKAQMRERTARRLEGAADGKGKRLDDISEIEQQSAGLREAAIDEKMRNFQNDYNIEFSEVKLALYQEPNVLKTIKANPASNVYAPSFANRAILAIQTGWAIILEILIGVLHLWSVFLLGFGAWWAYRKMRKHPFFAKK
jgi:Domain of unknown function (DUF4349)